VFILANDEVEFGFNEFRQLFLQPVSIHPETLIYRGRSMIQPYDEDGMDNELDNDPGGYLDTSGVPLEFRGDQRLIMNQPGGLFLANQTSCFPTDSDDGSGQVRTNPQQKILFDRGGSDLENVSRLCETNGNGEPSTSFRIHGAMEGEPRSIPGNVQNGGGIEENQMHVGYPCSQDMFNWNQNIGGSSAYILQDELPRHLGPDTGQPFQGFIGSVGGLPVTAYCVQGATTGNGCPMPGYSLHDGSGINKGIMPSYYIPAKVQNVGPATPVPVYYLQGDLENNGIAYCMPSCLSNMNLTQTYYLPVPISGQAVTVPSFCMQGGTVGLNGSPMSTGPFGAGRFSSNWQVLPDSLHPVSQAPPTSGYDAYLAAAAVGRTCSQSTLVGEAASELSLIPGNSDMNIASHSSLIQGLSGTSSAVSLAPPQSSSRNSDQPQSQTYGNGNQLQQAGILQAGSLDDQIQSRLIHVQQESPGVSPDHSYHVTYAHQEQPAFSEIQNPLVDGGNDNVSNVYLQDQNSFGSDLYPVSNQFESDTFSGESTSVSEPNQSKGSEEDDDIQLERVGSAQNASSPPQAAEQLELNNRLCGIFI